MASNAVDGFILLSRGITKSPTWRALKPMQQVILITLLLMANHKDGEWWDNIKKEFVTVKRGQFITSLSGIQEECGKHVSIQNIRTCLLVLEKMQFLTSKSTNKYRLITIDKYDLYQTPNNYLTRKLTSNQQATNKQLTTNKNDKNDKNDKKKDIYADHVLLTAEEHKKLVDKLGEQKVLEMIERLNMYGHTNGKAFKGYTSHYHVILNWHQRDLKGGGSTNKRASPKLPRAFESMQKFLEQEDNLE